VRLHTVIGANRLHIAVRDDDRALACEAVSWNMLVLALTETPDDAGR